MLSQALLAEVRLPDDVEAAVRENISYCLAAGASDPKPVRDRPRKTAGLHEPTLLKHLCPSFEHRPLELDVSPQWPQFNPTIAADDVTSVIVRTANYRLINGSYRFLTDDGTIRTINHCARLNRRLELVGAEALTDRSSSPPLYPSRVQGYEDCRLVRLSTAWAVTATVRDRNPVERCETALPLPDGAEITCVRILNSPWPGLHAKNWMPFSVDDSLHVLYSCGPTVVLRDDTTNGAPEKVAEGAGTAGRRRLARRSQGVHTAAGRLFVVHQALDVNGRRGYSHRFLLLDADYTIAAMSAPFSLTRAWSGILRRAGEARRSVPAHL